MPSLESLDQRLQTVENIIQAAVNLPDSLLKWNDPEVQAGDKVFGQDASLFDGDEFFADVVNAPVTVEADLENVFRY